MFPGYGITAAHYAVIADRLASWGYAVIQASLVDTGSRSPRPARVTQAGAGALLGYTAGFGAKHSPWPMPGSALGYTRPHHVVVEQGIVIRV